MRHVVVLDAADVGQVSAFWAQLLGGGVLGEEDDAFHCVIDRAGHWIIGVQHSPDHQPPEWPDGNSQQVHLDLHVTDAKAGLAKARAVGARPLLTEDDPGTQHGHHVFADPAGHPFCIGWGHPTPEALTRYLATNPPSVT